MRHKFSLLHLARVRRQYPHAVSTTSTSELCPSCTSRHSRFATQGSARCIEAADRSVCDPPLLAGCDWQGSSPITADAVRRHTYLVGRLPSRWTVRSAAGAYHSPRSAHRHWRASPRSLISASGRLGSGTRSAERCGRSRCRPQTHARTHRCRSAGATGGTAKSSARWCGRSRVRCSAGRQWPEVSAAKSLSSFLPLRDRPHDAGVAE
jgi:hypothetical protein